MSYAELDLLLELAAQFVYDKEYKMSNMPVTDREELFKQVKRLNEKMADVRLEMLRE
jgi:hypothetical protein